MSQRQPDCGQSFFVRWKPAGALRRHGLRVNPDRELTASALDDLGVDPGFLFDERRHTGRAGTVISHLAVTNTDAFHVLS